MATLNTVICLFTFQAVVLMDKAVADPGIDINPTEISLGISPALDINCTFSLTNHTDLAALVSLNLLRANASGQDFNELAIITQFSPHSVNLITQESVTATGVNSQTGDSYLHLKWEYPMATQGGVYQCAAHGLDMLGHNVEFTNTSVVTVEEANLNDIFEKLKQMEIHEKTLENKISSLQNQLENTTSFMDNKVSSMENTITSMEDTISSQRNHTQTLETAVTQLKSWAQYVIGRQLQLLGTYQDKEYFVPKENYQDFHESITVCELFGGTLIEFDDEKEYNAVVGFLQNVTSDIKYVIVGGTDEQSEGNWILPSSNLPIPFTAWQPPDPGVATSWNCLGMYIHYSWRMYDENCHFGNPQNGKRFTCEISSVAYTGQK